MTPWQLIARSLWFAMRAPLFLLLAAIAPRTGPRIASDTVAIYIRWSTDEQAQGTTLDVQRDACRNQAKAWQFGEIPVERVFIDDGYSGGSLDRPAMTRLRELVMQGRVNCVIVYKIDRLSRNIVDATGLVLREWDGRCHLKCVMDPVDTTTELGRMIFSMLAMFADFERGQIRARTVAGKLRRASEGKSIAEAPYGYIRQDKQMIIVESEAAIVRFIFEWYVGGMGAAQICKQLATKGIRTREGYLWGRSSVIRLLRNETYKGNHVYGRTRTGRDGEAERVKRDTPLVDIAETVPTIIQPDLWEQAQRLRSDRKTRMTAGGRSIGSRHLLSGLAKCRCGSALIAKQDRTGTWYYVCAKRRDKGACDCGWIPYDKVHAIILSHLKPLQRDAVIARLREITTGMNTRMLEELQVATSTEESRVKRAAQEIERIDRDYRAGRLSPERYDRNIRAAEAEHAEAVARLQVLSARMSEAATGSTEAESVAEQLSFLADWNILDDYKRREVLRSILSSVTLYREPKGGTLDMNLRVKGVLLEELSNGIDE